MRFPVISILWFLFAFPFQLAAGQTIYELTNSDVIKHGSKVFAHPYGADCLRPFCPPDRWDDVDSDGAWDDAEFYHPALTGFRAPDDVGSSITLMLLNPTDDWGMFWFYAVNYGPINTGDPIHTGADSYRNWIGTECEPYIVSIGDGLQIEPGNMVGPTIQGLNDLIEQDSSAYWNEGTNTVEGSAYGSNSPRIMRVPAFDPTLGLRTDPNGRKYLTVSQVMVLFLEENAGGGNMVVRFMETLAPPGLGDANGDSILDIGDVIYILNYLFKPDDAPEPFYTGDVNCDGTVDIGDAIYLLNYLFKNGQPPCEP
jgi:hypothetical protein